LGLGIDAEVRGLMELPDDGKSFKIGLAVLMQYRLVTASQPATQPSHVAVAYTALTTSRG